MKSTSSVTSFLRYCKEITNLLFWKLWECLAIPIKNHRINLYETFMLICIQKINFITHFFLKILKRNNKLVILGNLGMHGNIHLNWQYQFEKTFNVYLQAKNQLRPSGFPWDVAKILQTSYFGYFGLPGYPHSKWYYQVLEDFHIYLQAKNELHPHVFLEILQRYMQTSYFVYLGHAWLRTPKMIVSTCRKLQCLSACQKYTSFFISLFRHYILKNSAIWLANSILAHKLRTRILPGIGLVVINNNISFHFSYFQEKLITIFLKKIQKPLYLGHFGPFCPNFGKNVFSSNKGLCQFLIPFFNTVIRW